MITIYKYPIPFDDVFCIDMPADAEILTVQVQDKQPCVWAKIDVNNPTHKRTFRLAGTGHQIDPLETWEYVGTIQLQGGALVFHLFVEPV